jgi:hypothetical protein
MVRHHLAPIAFSIVVLATTAAPLDAQARDPVAEARSLFDARQSATAIAAMLKREHTRALDESATILRAVGVSARALVPALRVEYAPTLSALYASLKQAGFGLKEISDGFRDNLLALECIDPQGYAVPCGSFGGTADAAVTGQVSWSPKPEGETGGQLSISASNLPAIFVRIGSLTLTELNRNASTVLVRLPSAPIEGPLKIVRKSDNVVGLLQSDYRVVAPPFPWPAFTEAAIQGAVADMKAWMSGARIVSGCVVNGALATAPIGHFTSATGFNGSVRTKLLAAGASAALADGWDLAFRSAFTNYTANVTIPSLPLYPTLVTVLASTAAPVPNVPTPLALFVSVGAVSMQAPILASSLLTAITPASPAGSARDAAVNAFAGAVAGRFSAMLTASVVTMLSGGGPVPKYNPPAVSAAAVEGGSCSGTNIVAVPPNVW